MRIALLQQLNQLKNTVRRIHGLTLDIFSQMFQVHDVVS